ncbi:MAG: HEAT repeat domain-containing protein [Planctomycetota bacterium]
MRAALPLIVALLVAGAAAYLFLARAPGPPARPAPAGAPAPGPVVPPQAPSPPPAAEVDDALTEAVDAFLENLPVELPAGPAQVLEETLRDGGGPIDYKHALETSLRQRKGADLEAARLLANGLQGADEAYLFQHALVLAQRSGDPQVASVLLGALDDAPDRVRPHLVFALRGSNEPRVVERFLALYADDRDPAVRAKAGFVLGERGPRLDPLLVERARATARADLRADDPELVESAADVLGIPPLEDGDRRVLVETVRHDPTPSRRLAALRALAAGGADPAQLTPLLEQLRQSPDMPPELREAAEALLHPEEPGGQ